MLQDSYKMIVGRL